MDAKDRETTAEELLAQSGWLRRLALRLVGDADVADDLVQETWIAAAKKTPDRATSMRPWLGKVLRDAFRMRARSEGRRAAREQAVAALDDESPSPETLVARAEAQRRLVGLVLRLDEPYRETVLLHFSEGVSLADIARRQGIPAGTVRWRLKAAVDQLRTWLDESETGGRKQWAVTLLALPKGVVVAQKTSKFAAVVVALLLLLFIGGGYVMWLQVGGGKKSAEPAAQRGGPASASGATGASTGAHRDEPPVPAWLAQGDLAPRRIAGHVFNPDGTPVSGAIVSLASLATFGELVPAPQRRTDASGAFDFGAQLPMGYSVHAWAPGKTGAWLSVDLRQPFSTRPADRLELRLGPCDNAIFGTVRDATGNGIEGARVTWLQVGPAGDLANRELIAGTTVKTGASGAYEVCVIGGRESVSVEVAADAYGAISLRTQVWGRRKIDFALVPEAVVVGRVIREDDRTPVARAMVVLGPAQWGAEQTATRAAFTDGDGRFRITGVAPGSHLVEAIAGGMATARETPIVVAAGRTSVEVELVLESRSTVRGIVTDDGKPVAGAVVTARSDDPQRGSADAVSQADGSFVLDRVARGPVHFVVRPYDVVSPKAFVVDRPAHDGVVIEVDRLGVITGTVVRHDEPVAGALIELRGVSAFELGPIRSGVDGRFEARGLRPGKWLVFAGHDGIGAFGRAAEEIELEAGGTTDVTVELTYGAAISGVVVDQDGAPVPAVTVVYQHTARDDIGFGATSTDGRFRAAMMEGGGTYRATVRPGPYARASLRPASGSEFPLVALADGEAEVTGVVLAIRLDRLTIAGRVVDEDGAPVADARVTAEQTQAGVEPRFGRWLQQATAITDGDGGFSIGDLSSGTYALDVRATTGTGGIVGGIAAGRRDVAIVLPSAGSIEGTLTGFAQMPTVIAVREDSRAPDAPLLGTVTGNTFTVASLSPGTYAVSAYSSSEAASARVTVVAGTAARVALTGGGSGSVRGRVRDFRTGAAVQGFMCTAHGRVGDMRTSGAIGIGARSDRDGAFELASAPAGDIAISCWGAGSTYSDGQRLLTVGPGQRLDVDVPVVDVRHEVSITIGGMGADFDRQSMVPRLDRIDPRGPAAGAGLVNGDVVIAVDDASVTDLSPRGVWTLITNRAPGTAVKVMVRRGSRTVAVDLVLGPADER